jgi:hypothetical protein
MPPELCIVLGLSPSVVRSAYLIPSVMNRLYSVMLASQLRHSIQTAAPQTPTIPVMRVRLYIYWILPKDKLESPNSDSAMCCCGVVVCLYNL